MLVDWLGGKEEWSWKKLDFLYALAYSMVLAIDVIELPRELLLAGLNDQGSELSAANATGVDPARVLFHAEATFGIVSVYDGGAILLGQT